MFRLEKNQIHIVFYIVLAISALFFLIFGISDISGKKINVTLSEMEDFSDGWIGMYDTDDTAIIEEKKAQGYTVTDKTVYVTDALNLPKQIPSYPGKTVTMTKKLPDYGLEDIYLLFHTKAESIQIIVDEDIVYNSGKLDENIPSDHVVCVGEDMRGHIITVMLTGDKSGMEIDRISTGTYANLLYSAWKENGYVGLIGLLLLVFGIVLFIPWLLFKNTERQKALLKYSLMESICLGVLFIMDSRMFQVLSGWNYTIYLVKAFMLILASLLHITVIHSSMYKKKILFLTSLGILFYGILFISVIVFQAFGLITVVTTCKAIAVCAMLGVLVYTVILMVGLYSFGRKECFVLFWANALLLLGIVAHLLGMILKHGAMPNCIFIAAGSMLYMLFIYIYGMRLTFTQPKKNNRGEKTEEEIKAQLVEQLNPNLLFASFSSLQSLIKNGSSNSVKMIYYISIYLRDNLRALEHSGEVISFEEEMEHIIAYLQLQKTRNAGLNFSIECKETDFVIPRYSIEPMVENAVKHGIAKNGNKGNVVVRTYQRAEGYAIQVIDDGIGFDKSTLKRHSQTALLNLFSLLEKSFNAKVELITKEDKGTVITIVLPMLENDLQKENEENNE